MIDFGFQLLAEDGEARRGRLTTAHGTIETPAFMTVGTAGSVNGLQPQEVAATGAEIVLGNTYHLMLRPGAERVARLGGLHAFMRWPGPIITDSGGYQVMSLSQLRRLDEKGVTFRSHIDGSYHRLTPERAMEIQHLLDSDITMALDECTPYPADHATAETSMELSMRWAKRCKAAFVERPGYALFGIVQGSVYSDLRARSVAALTEIGFPGYAIGGLAVGEGQKQMLETLEATAPLMPRDKPRYLMGVGKPDDLVKSVLRGVDMFDCVLPTRSGRTGQAFTSRGAVNIRNARHQDDPRPLDEETPSPASDYSRAYLHLLFRAREMLGPILLTLHNLCFYQGLMARLRQAVEEQRMEETARAFFAEQERGDIPPYC